MNEVGPPPASNIPEYTVTEISGAVRRTLEGAFGRVRVRGEITELRRYGSGHTYLALKDEGGKLRAVIWKSAAARLGLAPENGVEVIATGRVTSYGDRSEYQLVIERLDYAGAGAMLARIEALRVRLAAEGLFDAGRKRALPMLPRVVGVITSLQGAVLQDIRTTIERRFPRLVLVFPVPVQGEGAAARIAAAIEAICRLPAPGLPRPDVLIVARGGGSLEDLMAFNDEAVVRAAASCPIPLISAVGHETDTTLIDHAADRRAPTPTAAAELAVPARSDLMAALAQAGARLAGSRARLLNECRLRLSRAAGRLPPAPHLLDAARQRLDDRGQRLVLALPNLLAARRRALERAERQIPDPRHVLDRQHAAVQRLMLTLRAALDGRLRAARARAGQTLPRLSAAPAQALLRERRARLEGAAARLEGASPQAVLARGYARVEDRSGRPVTKASAVAPGAALRIRFADGTVEVRAEKQGALPL